MKSRKIFPKNFLISCGLLLLALVLRLSFPSVHRSWMVVAMMLSWLGDLALMDYQKLFSKYTPSPFVTGGILFMLSHVCYGISFLRFTAEAGGRLSSAGMLVGLLLGIAAYLSLLWIGKRNRCLTGSKAGLLALYTAFEVFDIVCIFACCFGLPEALGWLLRLLAPTGIVLFLISDYFIGMDKVAEDRRMTQYIWIFYPLGQLLILLGA